MNGRLDHIGLGTAIDLRHSEGLVLSNRLWGRLDAGVLLWELHRGVCHSQGA